MLSFQKNSVFQGRSHSHHCGKAFVKHAAFLNYDLCVLSFGPTEACRHELSVFCAKHHEQLSMIGVIVNLLGEETSESSSEMLHIFIWHCSGTAYNVVAYVVTRHFLFLIFVPLHYRSVNQYCMVQVHLIKLESNTDVDSALPAT
jgi:hypothetical protein